MYIPHAQFSVDWTLGILGFVSSTEKEVKEDEDAVSFLR